MKLKRAGLWTALAAVLSVMLAGTAEAATPSASLQIRVTVNVSLSVNMGGATAYDFGTVNASTVVASTSAVVLTNDSGGRTEDYSITTSTFLPIPGGNWNLSGTLAGGANAFALCAALNSVQLSTQSFAASQCLSSNNASGNGSATWMSASQFNGDQNGKSVPSAATRNLWLYFAAPTSMTAGANQQQALTLTVTANDASLF